MKKSLARKKSPLPCLVSIIIVFALSHCETRERSPHSPDKPESVRPNDSIKNRQTTGKSKTGGRGIAAGLCYGAADCTGKPRGAWNWSQCKKDLNGKSWKGKDAQCYNLRK